MYYLERNSLGQIIIIKLSHYHSPIVAWIIGKIESFINDVMKRNKLDILINFDLNIYVINDSDIYLNM